MQQIHFGIRLYAIMKEGPTTQWKRIKIFPHLATLLLPNFIMEWWSGQWKKQQLLHHKLLGRSSWSYSKAYRTHISHNASVSLRECIATGRFNLKETPTELQCSESKKTLSMPYSLCTQFFFRWLATQGGSKWVNAYIHVTNVSFITVIKILN